MKSHNDKENCLIALILVHVQSTYDFCNDHLHSFYTIKFDFFTFHKLKLKRIDRLKHFYSMLLHFVVSL